MGDAPAYAFRAATERDLLTIAAWLALPHWREWWGEPEGVLMARDRPDTPPVKSPAL